MAENPRTWRVCGALAVAVVLVFSGALRCGFVDYDDPAYIVSNAEIQHGLTARSLWWALSTGAASNWHPLTWLSHILDAAIYGLKPAGHHLTSLLLHAANSVLLLLLLRRMTGALWRSAFVAALFALHPLRVESVVWVSERKDVLSGLFWLLAVWAYVRHVEEIRVGEAGRKGLYALAVALFALGLMAKPMLVTLPFVLLLLDWWPLGRRPEGLKQLLTEKIPFFALAAASSVATYLVQQHGGAVSHGLPLGGRLANAVISYPRYLGKMFWPVDLSVLYPHPGRWPGGEVAAAGIFLVLTTGLAVWGARRRPYLAVGWFWFLGMLAPVIGVVQVGLQSMADRYSYLSLTGVLIMVAWGANDLLGGDRIGRWTLGILGGAAVAACVVLTPRQVGYWKDSETLFRHAVQVTWLTTISGSFFPTKGITPGRRSTTKARWRSIRTTKTRGTTWDMRSPRKGVTRRRWRNMNGPCASIPSSPRRTTTWATRWPAWAGARTPSASIRLPWRKIPVMPTRITIMASPWR